MSTNVAEPLPFEVGQLGGFEARMMHNFRAAVEDWDAVCSALGGWEAQHLTKDEGQEAKERHRGWVEKLLAWGRVVQRATQESAFPDKALAQRVSARVRHLEDKLAIWHRQMSPSEEERILHAAFQ
ncbi:MAG: hypothetical protein C5B50_23165 [Verrucomicrobia bacterium]|nr:MAG: hypothetical protein C5B50_23165 [Verrucomicrobiota bacterium]